MTLHPFDRDVPLMYFGNGREDLGSAILHAVWTAKHCVVPVILVFSGELLCVEPDHTEAEVLEAWARSRSMARQARRKP